ncbi:hypothetical protein llap_20399 [Limosa lapponica baueri]|uniref:Uncharacterized protein n=1 Tax=Limosa lapponica baueri TaxID=1758121 RepID=A0A2I0T659_LIMLA|nr:hypothetical protein llap_20399 [Limosa lapponica baueri]
MPERFEVQQLAGSKKGAFASKERGRGSLLAIASYFLCFSSPIPYHSLELKWRAQAQESLKRKRNKAESENKEMAKKPTPRELREGGGLTGKSWSRSKSWQNLYHRSGLDKIPSGIEMRTNC